MIKFYPFLAASKHIESRIVKFNRKECKSETTRAWKEGEMGSYFLMVTAFLLEVMKRFGNK